MCFYLYSFKSHLRRRDRVKAAKFQKLLQEGGLPDHVKRAYMDAWNKGGQQRKLQTQLVNSLFERKGGTLVMRADKPQFSQYKDLGYWSLSCCSIPSIESYLSYLLYLSYLSYLSSSLLVIQLTCRSVAASCSTYLNTMWLHLHVFELLQVASLT